jgi:hypothetical protein
MFGILVIVSVFIIHGKDFMMNIKRQNLDFEHYCSAAWISPSGDTSWIPYTHVKAVIKDPEKFGLSLEQIKEIYKKHNEGIGSEGKARDEIVSLLISNGWIRIRLYPEDSEFHVEVNSLTENIKEILSKWASKVLEAYPDRGKFNVRVKERMVGSERVVMLGECLKERDK